MKRWDSILRLCQSFEEKLLFRDKEFSWRTWCGVIHDLAFLPGLSVLKLVRPQRGRNCSYPTDAFVGVVRTFSLVPGRSLWPPRPQ